MKAVSIVMHSALAVILPGFEARMQSAPSDGGMAKTYACMSLGRTLRRRCAAPRR